MEDEESLLLQASQESMDRPEPCREISIDRQKMRNSRNRMSQADSIPRQQLTQRSGTDSANKQGNSIEGNETTNDTRASPK